LQTDNALKYQRVQVYGVGTKNEEILRFNEELHCNIIKVVMHVCISKGK